MSHEYPSQLLANAVEAFASLPGIGRRTALRLVLYLLRQPLANVEGFAEAVARLRQEVKYCHVCKSISDKDTCSICSDTTRDHGTICVVQNIQDVMAIENTGQYRGVYHVLGGVISPMDGVGPSDLNMESLVDRVAEGNVKEVILALSSTTEGETTGFYVSRKLSSYDVRLSTIARGISVGEELEYTDEITLGRSITDRVVFHRD